LSHYTTAAEVLWPAYAFDPSGMRMKTPHIQNSTRFIIDLELKGTKREETSPLIAIQLPHGLNVVDRESGRIFADAIKEIAFDWFAQDREECDISHFALVQRK